MQRAILFGSIWGTGPLVLCSSSPTIVAARTAVELLRGRGADALALVTCELRAVGVPWVAQWRARVHCDRNIEDNTTASVGSARGHRQRAITLAEESSVGNRNNRL